MTDSSEREGVSTLIPVILMTCVRPAQAGGTRQRAFRSDPALLSSPALDVLRSVRGPDNDLVVPGVNRGGWRQDSLYRASLTPRERILRKLQLQVPRRAAHVIGACSSSAFSFGPVIGVMLLGAVVPPGAPHVGGTGGSDISNRRRGEAFDTGRRPAEDHVGNSRGRARRLEGRAGATDELTWCHEE